ncbi:MAG: ABC transporter permease [Flavobacteriaceae bacterium]|nr:ABC transporter permease [Flavobacteriaceae bacterium]
MNHLSLIIKREYLTKVKNRSFIVMTIVSPIIMVILFAVVAYLTQLNNQKVRVISVLDEIGIAKSVFEDSPYRKFQYLEGIDLETAKTMMSDAENQTYGMLYIPKNEDYKVLAKSIKFYAEETPSLELISDLEYELSERITELNYVKNNIDIQSINKAKAVVTLQQETYEGEKTTKLDNILKLIFGLAAGYLLFMFIIIYGNMIMRSVIEEKTSRIIEIIISSVKPVQLLLGKIVGTSLAGITQFMIWMIIGGMLMTITPLLFGFDLQAAGPEQEIIQQAMQENSMQEGVAKVWAGIRHLPILNLVLAFVFYFIGGYLLYSSLYAAIGAAVDNETDTQQFMMPVLMPLMLAVYVGIFTVIEDPHGTVATVFSFIPFTSSVVMLMRIPFGVPIWQQLVSLLLLFATFLACVWFAAKIYRVGILMYGKKPSYKELIKWLKY